MTVASCARVRAKPRDLGIAARRREILVKNAAGELRAMAERCAEHFEGFVVRHEDQRLLLRVSPALRLCQQPLEAGILAIHRFCLTPQDTFVRPEHALLEWAVRAAYGTDALDPIPA